MNECKECVYIKDIDRRLTEVEAQVKSMNATISDIKVERASDKEQIKTIFMLLKKMDDSIAEIVQEVKKLNDKPALQFDAVKVAIISALASGVIGSLITFLAKK